MEIHYKSKKIKKILTDQRLIKRYYGRDYRNIMSRMTELESVDNLSYISTSPPPVRHKLIGKYKGCWAVWYSKNDRIVFEPLGYDENSETKYIKKIRIIDLGDYH